MTTETTLMTSEPADSNSSPRRPPLRLTRARAEAQQSLRNQLKIGGAIRGQRISNRWELDQARAEKQEWVNRTADLLTTLFSDESMTESFNDWVGTVLPEYAEFEMFVEQFGQEMKQRLTRLQDILRRLENVREPLPQMPPHAVRPVDAASTLAAISAAPIEAVAAERSAEPEKSSSAGLLLVRSADAQRRQAILSFTEKLGLSASVIGAGGTPEENQNACVANELSCHADAAFAIVLTDGAPGATEAGAFLFELGCCVGRLGAARVCVLRNPNEQGNGGNEPTTLERAGVRLIPIEPAGEGWQLALARHLKAGGVEIDLNRLV